MEKKQIMTIVVIAVVVLVVAACAIVLLNGSEKKVSASFLIEDQDGVYLWASGEGNGYFGAFDNAMAPGYFSYEKTVTGNGIIITSINGLAQTEDTTGYWALYCYENGKWVKSDECIDKLSDKEIGYFAYFYVEVNSHSQIVKGGPDNLTFVPDVKDAAYWKDSKDGVLFQIESRTGFRTAINGSGETAFDALVDATEKYKIPFQENTGGINWLFNKDLYMKQVGTQWIYWQQYITKDGVNWSMNGQGLRTTTGVSYVYLYYNYYGTAPSVPVYSGKEIFTVTLNSDPEGAGTFKYALDDSKSENYTKPFWAAKDSTLKVDVIPEQSYAFASWEDGSTSASRTAKVSGDVSWTAKCKMSLDYIADAVVNNYSGHFGDATTGKFVRNASSTSDRIVLDGYYKDFGEEAQYSIIIGTSSNAAETLATLKAQSKYADFRDKPASVAILADTTFENFDGFFYNMNMRGGSVIMYFGFTIGDVYVDGYTTSLRDYSGRGPATYGQAVELFKVIADAAGERFEDDQASTIGQFVADKYDGAFGEYKVEDGKLYAHRGTKTYGPMVFVVMDDEGQAKAKYDSAAVFSFDDVCSYDKSKMTVHGYGQITAKEQKGSTSMVFSPSVDKFDGFLGYYACRPMGDSNSNPMYFVACYKNVYISSAMGISIQIDDTGSNYQYVNGTGAIIENDDLTDLLDTLINAITLVNGGTL